MRAVSVGLSATFVALVAAAPVQSQVKFTIDKPMSLAWWQVNPHLNHLWATTCPQEPSWRPGEGRSIAWAQQFLSARSKTGYAAVKDTIIPLYPRRRARSLCGEAVSGEFTVQDTVALTGVTGTISVLADQLTTGVDMRDNYAKHSILNTAAYPAIKFTIDSISSLTKTRRDTLAGKVYGKFYLHGVEQPKSADIRIWHDPVGLRATAKFMIPAEDMIDVYKMSKYSLGLGVGQTVWDELWMGVDVILRPETAEGS